VREVFQDLAPRFLSDRRMEFMCHCSRLRLKQLMALLPLGDLQELRENGPFPLELRCHHCSSRYALERSELDRIIGLRYASN